MIRHYTVVKPTRKKQCIWPTASDGITNGMKSRFFQKALSPHRDPLDRHAVPHADSDEDEERELTERLL